MSSPVASDGGTRSTTKGLAVGALAFIILVAALLVPFIPVTRDVRPRSIPVFQISDTTIQQDLYVEASSQLSAGQDASASWSASDTVDVYIFNSTQYSVYSKSGDSSNSMAGETNKQAGTIGFHVQVSGTYYLVVYDEDIGVYGAGNLYESIYLYSAGGTATSPPSATSCHENLMTALSGGHC